MTFILGCAGLRLDDIDSENPSRCTALYRVWLWKHLGMAKGTRDLCPEWADPEVGFLRFYACLAPSWFAGAVLARRYRDSRTGDVIQVDGNLPYSPSTCEWATRDENYQDFARARARSWMIEGEKVTTREVADRLGVNMNVAYGRLHNGARTWEELQRRKGTRRPQVRYYEVEGERVTLADVRNRVAAEGLSISSRSLQCRLASGDRTWERLLRPQVRRAPRLASANKPYLVDGHAYSLREVQARLSPECAEAAAWRLPRGWNTWDQLERPVTRDLGYRGSEG